MAEQEALAGQRDAKLTGAFQDLERESTKRKAALDGDLAAAGSKLAALLGEDVFRGRNLRKACRCIFLTCSFLTANVAIIMFNLNEILSEFREHFQNVETSWRVAEMFANVCMSYV